MTRLTEVVPSALPSAAARRSMECRFDLRELSGSLGDLGTFLPLALAMALRCDMGLGPIFIFAGLMNIATGLWLRQPVPVQPMKAIAAVAIAEGLTVGAIASAGMLVGAAMLVLAMAGGVDWIARVIPKPVVRGIQAGIGIKLAYTGLCWLWRLSPLGWDSWLVALTVGGIVAVCLGRRQPILLYLFVAGFGLLWLGHPDAYRALSMTLPSFPIVQPTAGEWWIGLTRGAVPQLPLTVLNSVIAVCALSADYFPGRGIEPKRMAASVGLMNLLCVPLGGLPMCHGAGGLAAQYHFGARTGGSVVMLGGLKIVAGLLLGGGLLTTLQHYPASILGVMIVVAGVSLAAAARDALRGRSLVIVAVMVTAMLAINTLAGFAMGCALALIWPARASTRRG
jgi:MFS superfamily sulfate permease-like transporter